MLLVEPIFFSVDFYWQIGKTAEASNVLGYSYFKNFSGKQKWIMNKLTEIWCRFVNCEDGVRFFR